MAVSHVAFTMYPVSDLPRALAFYRDVLGLTSTDFESPFWAEFDVAGATFGIGTFPQVGKAGSAQSLALEVADLAGFRSQIIEKGGSVSEPHELANCWISVIADPDGNQIWLHQLKAAT